MSQNPPISFAQKLSAAVARNNSLLCVGLDPSPEKFPAHFGPVINTESLATWGKSIIEQTADYVCCYKPQIAFYEQYGPAGLEALRQTIAAVPADIPVLLDAKRGDIDSTAAAYARAAFEALGADAVTVNPYLGQDSITPFLNYPGKAVFVLCYTSNRSAKTVQEFEGNGYLFEHIARLGQTWGTADQVGFVVGATQPHALARVRRLAPQSWILAPGVGAQGADLREALAAGLNADGTGLIVPVSRAVLYAKNVRAAAQSLRDEINVARQAVVSLPASAKKSPHTELILGLHAAGCVQFGNFTLASGKQSPVYIDLRRTTSSAGLLRLIARAYADLIRPLSFEHLAGVPYAALPIGTATALELGCSLIYPRKEVKTHGTGKNIEGVFAPGDRAVMIEDLVTSGGSVVKAAETLKEASLAVTDVAVLIDREQGGPQNLAAAGYTLHAVITFTEVLDVLRLENRISEEEYRAVKSYLNNE